MSEIEMLGLAGVGIIALFLVARAILRRGRDADEGDLVGADGENSTE